MTSAGVPVGLAVWAHHSRLASRPAAMAGARAAMHTAVRTASAPASSHSRRFRLARPRLSGLLTDRIRLTTASMAAAGALVIGAGWDAGPGSPLHSIQLARQDASLVLASGTQAVDLRLQYAETRLRSAAAGSDRVDNLAEAASLLSAARQDLPASHTGPGWLRWSHDESVLAGLVAAASAPASSEGSAGGGRGSDDGQVNANDPGEHRGGGNDGGAGRGTGGGSPPLGGPSPSGDDGGGVSGSGRAPAPVVPAISNDGGGGSRGDGGPSTPDPSPTPGGHGGDGGGGGGGGA
jgi:hypothetical protein